MSGVGNAVFGIPFLTLIIKAIFIYIYFIFICFIHFGINRIVFNIQILDFYKDYIVTIYYEALASEMAFGRKILC